MSIRLRAHHLLCMLTFAGEGYSPAFTANFARIVRRIGRGEEIELVAGPDDICAPLLTAEACHCRRASIVERDRQAAEALSHLLSRPLAPGARINLDAALLARMRAAFAAGAARKACEGCEWAGICTAIAAAGFRQVRLVARP